HRQRAGTRAPKSVRPLRRDRRSGRRTGPRVAASGPDIAGLNPGNHHGRSRPRVSGVKRVSRRRLDMAEPRPSVADKRRTFQRLHESGCFVIPNPWDVGSARFLQSLGFKALATTSAGFAWSPGRSDNGVTRDMVISHLTEIVEIG